MTINNLLEGKMEQRTPDELKRELQLIQDDLQSVKLQHARLTKAATHLGNAIQTLCKQEQARLGLD
jgi:prefoldin subunit 5